MDNVYCSKCKYFSDTVYCGMRGTEPYNYCMAPSKIIGSVTKEECALYPERIEDVYERRGTCQNKNKNNDCKNYTPKVLSN